MNVSNVGIVTKPRKIEVARVGADLVDWFADRGIAAFLDEDTARRVGRADSGRATGTLGSQCDLVVVIGGDGTLLAGARLLDGRDVPILAINYGGLGFLTGVTLSELHTDLEKALAGEFVSDFRMMLDAAVVRGGVEVASHRALNDVVINKGTPARIIEVEARVDEEYVSTFRADGLIISTPTGSTAYNLSAGGPIVHPALRALLMTPICSHTLTNRPIVLPETVRVDVTVRSDGEEGVYATLDGQIGVPMESGDRLSVRTSSRRVHLIAPAGKSYFDVLRGKLKWG